MIIKFLAVRSLGSWFVCVLLACFSGVCFFMLCFINVYYSFFSVCVYLCYLSLQSSCTVIWAKLPEIFKMMMMMMMMMNG